MSLFCRASPCSQLTIFRPLHWPVCLYKWTKAQRRSHIKWWWTSSGEVSVLPRCAFWSIVQPTDLFRWTGILLNLILQSERLLWYLITWINHWRLKFVYLWCLNFIFLRPNMSLNPWQISQMCLNMIHFELIQVFQPAILVHKSYFKKLLLYLDPIII